MLMIEHVIIADGLACMAGVAAHVRNNAGLNAARDFVVGLVVADGVEEIAPFVYVRILVVVLDFGLPDALGGIGVLTTIGAGRFAAVTVLRGDGDTFGAVHV